VDVQRRRAPAQSISTCHATTRQPHHCTTTRRAVHYTTTRRAALHHYHKDTVERLMQSIAGILCVFHLPDDGAARRTRRRRAQAPDIVPQTARDAVSGRKREEMVPIKVQYACSTACQHFSHGATAPSSQTRITAGQRRTRPRPLVRSNRRESAAHHTHARARTHTHTYTHSHTACSLVTG